jgi:multicomponent Na+:H+ antiporter subunit F
MTSADLLLHATTLALALLVAALLLSVVRLARGPSLADRILVLDTMTTLGIGVIAVMAIRTGIVLYLDIAIAIGLVGFLSTIALARYLLDRHGKRRTES